MSQYSSDKSDKDSKAKQERLEKIKKKIRSGNLYFKSNRTRFNKFQKFAFKTALSNADESSLRALDRPILEFNIVNAPISRLCGEYSKQEPAIYASAEDGYDVHPEMLMAIEGHFRYILFEANKHNTQYCVYRDQLSGGYSAYKVFTEYASEMSFEQVIRLARNYDPTMVFFDPLAREVTKSDAEYYGDYFPMALDEFKAEYPGVDTSKFTFTKTDEDFAWSYMAGAEKVVIVCHYYERKRVKKTIIKLANKQVMDKEKYPEFLKEWEKEGKIEQPPAIVAERKTTVSCFCRYVVVENEIIEEKETDFTMPSYIFVDGDSILLKNDDSSDGGAIVQFTKPYIYHAFGHQRLVNLAGQTIANDFENMTMHKFMVAEESLPQEEEWLEAYRDVQKPATLVYKAFSEEDPNKPNPPPQPVARVPLPQEVIETFNNSMGMLQNILGTYDASLGINNNQLSGVAIVEGATQSNAAAMPYVVNNIQGLNQVAQVIVSLIPKYYTTPRTIPIITKEGKHEFIKINEEGGLSLQYDPSSIHIKVEAGVSFAIAKNRALQQIIALMKASPVFAQFINEEGLDILLDNMEFRGVDIIKEKAKTFMEKLQAQQQQAAQQPNPEVIIAQSKQMDAQTNAKKVDLASQELAQKHQATMIDGILKVKELNVDKEKNDTDRLNVLAKIGESRASLISAAERAQAEEERARADQRIAISEHHLKRQDQEHQHLSDILRLGKELNQKPEKESNPN
jgi:hypothetical protein